MSLPVGMRHYPTPSVGDGLCLVRPFLAPLEQRCGKPMDDPIHNVWMCQVDEACYHGDGPCRCAP